MLLLKQLSRLNLFPQLAAVDPETLIGYRRSQALAFNCAHTIADLIQPGWTENQAARLMETFLRDNGVKSFFHLPFVWFGDRGCFIGIHNYAQYQPTNRVLREGEIFILDVAPILNGYACDIGYTDCLGESQAFLDAKKKLLELRTLIPNLFCDPSRTGESIWREVDAQIQGAGYENVHAKYPFSVLGHRLHNRLPEAGNAAKLLHFGWQAYWSLTSRGLFGQLLNQNFIGDKNGLWAIEPHLGGESPMGRFGAKFEEILVVQDGQAFWLEERCNAFG